MTNRHSISESFADLCTQEGSRVAIREQDRSVTFRDLLQWSQVVSRQLETVLSDDGERVVVILPNSGAFVAAFYGIARLSIVAPLSTQYRSKELAYYLRDLGAVAVLTEGRFIDPLLEVIPKLDIKPALFEVSANRSIRLVRPREGRGSPVRSFGSTPLLQLYTSGSTGAPKRVVRSHDALLAELRGLRGSFGVGRNDRFLGAAPFYHVNGLVRSMMASMYVGATLFPVDEFRRRETLDLLTSERITFFGGVPQMFTLLTQTPSRSNIDLSSLRIVFSSSAPLTVPDNHHFQSRYGFFVRQLYGSTETGTISFNRHDSPERYLQSVGLPLDGVRVEVVDDNGQRLPAGREGELAIASPFAAAGYLDNLTATNESFRHGLYFSGDLGVKDEAGYLTITGRKKLIINRGGFKVNPYEVEEVIREHPKVVNAVVFGSPGPHGDDIISCFIVASEKCTREEMLLHCRKRIADFKIPTRIEFRNVLPTSSTGKLLRAGLF